MGKVSAGTKKRKPTAQYRRDKSRVRFLGLSVGGDPRHWQWGDPLWGTQGPPGGYQYLYAIPTAILFSAGYRYGYETNV